MATTTNFGWETPDDTDLVKDGALAIRTLGNSIDTSLVDLKGGTTGQVLSKTSNTDMDFTWVTSDDANAIQNAIVDAKGDLIAASAADTPARLAVGADYGFLQALASASTGLQWNSGGWTTYTPTVTASGGTFTSVSATGRHIRIGKLVVVSVRVVITTNGTAAGLVLCTLPFTPQTSSAQVYSGGGRESASTGIAILGYIDANADLRIQKMDGTYPGANGYTLNVTVPYEVA